MNRIVVKKMLTPDIAWFEVVSPEISKRWKAGQFVIVRPRDTSERIPLTIVDGNREAGTIMLAVQAIGKTTKVLAALEAGDAIHDLVGPLGEPANVKNVGSVLCIGGGVGVAELLPVAKAFREAGNLVTALCGARTKDLMILDKELFEAVHALHWATDDGSEGLHGNVVDLMRHWWRLFYRYPPQSAHVIGPIPMMKAAANLTKEWGVPTTASLNPVMVDGTGMCGGCRVTVGGRVRFACVDGPEFDAHQVDFDELARRNRSYASSEQEALKRHICNIGLDTQ